MPAGKPRRADPGELYAFAHLFYWDFRRLLEGGTKRITDKKEYQRLLAEPVELTDSEKSQLGQQVEAEARAGRLGKKQRAARLRALEEEQLAVARAFRSMDAAEAAEKTLKIPGEPDVLADLLRAQTPEEIREICEDAFTQRKIEVAPGNIRDVRVGNWPVAAGSPLPRYLSEYASQFIAATNDPRFPRSTTRPSSRLKQLWFLSRALAGALFGVSVRTAVNLVGSKRPEQTFGESRAAKPSRKRMKKR